MPIQNDYTKNEKFKKNSLILSLYLLPLLLSGCLHVISNYDSATYTRLTDLKASVNILFDKLSADSTVNDVLKQELETVRLDIEKAYEYEKGKDKNTETIIQISKIRDMYIKMLNLLQKEEKLSSDYIADKKVNMMKAFDISIATEKGKIER